MQKGGGGAFSAGGEERLDTTEGMHRKFLENGNYLIISTEGRDLELILRSREQTSRATSESRPLPSLPAHVPLVWWSPCLAEIFGSGTESSCVPAGSPAFHLLSDDPQNKLVTIQKRTDCHTLRQIN